VPLGPAEVHPEQHLGPVRRLGAAGAGADGEDGRAVVVFAGEEQLGSLSRELRLERVRLAVRLGLEVGVARFLGQLDGRLEVIRAREEAVPELEIATEAVGFAQGVLRGSAVVPEARLRRARVELGQASLFAREVKAAPRSSGSAPAGRGRARRPLVALDPEVLEEDGTELDQPQG
jgi:hypothetical protein